MPYPRPVESKPEKSSYRGNTRSSVSRIFSGEENYLHAIRESARSSKISSPPRRGFLSASSSGISSRVINNAKNHGPEAQCEKVRTGRINICSTALLEEETSLFFVIWKGMAGDGPLDCIVR